MAVGYFIRLGDKTTCGGTVLEGDHGYLMGGSPRAFEGGRVSCGKNGKTYTIVGGISYISGGGRRVAATLDSASSCPCGAKLIASYFGATYESNHQYPASVLRPRGYATPQNSPDPSELSENPDPQSPPLASGSGLKTCNHPDQMEGVASYISGEMNNNIRHSSVLQMRTLISFDPYVETEKYMALPAYMRLGKAPDLFALALAKRAKALAIWVERVGQNRPWDHKPVLRKRFNGVWHKQGDYLYFYDIWSNIHYGYVGAAAGLSESVLLDGAGGEQIVSDMVRKVEELSTKLPADWVRSGPRPTQEPWTHLRSWDDVADRVAIGLGVKLFHQFPTGGLTTKVLMDAVLAIAPTQWGDGVERHACN